MTLAARNCPLCLSADLRDLGPVFHRKASLVAGVPIKLGDLHFRLLGCRQCSLEFKDPPIPEERLLECYAKAEATHWGHEVDPAYRQFDVLRNLLVRHATGRRILDVGCFNGDFLAYLGTDWDRSGIEPCESAAAMAAGRGIQILGSDVIALALGESTGEFDAITVIDVAEHLVQPKPFVDAIANLLAPGGVALFMTGSTDFWYWRLVKGKYWYCGLPEHVTFWNQASFRYSAVHAVPPLRLAESRRVRARREGVADRVRQLRYSMKYLVRILVDGVRVPGRKVLDYPSPKWLSARDHLVCVMKR